MQERPMFEHYEAQHFKSEFEAAKDRFEAFFTNPLMQERCHVSVEIEKPAAMILERPAIDWFGEDLFAQDRFRQAFGHAIRHVMESLGYDLDQTAVRIP